MSGLAALLKARGFSFLSGSDKAASKGTARVEALGIPVYIGHKKEQAENAALVIYSAAISPENPEFAYAKAAGIPMLSRAQLLGELSRLYNKSVGVAGTHGKTTVTSMLSHMLFKADFAPGIHIGGVLPAIGSNVSPGNGGLFVTEACEYVDSYLELSPDVSIILNIDEDHMDYFKTMENIEASFAKFAALTRPGGLVIGFAEDKRVAALLESCGRRHVTYGFSEGDYRAKNIGADALGRPSFDFCQGEAVLCRVQLGVLGRHNIGNAMAALLAAKECGLPITQGAPLLADFHGAGRRLEDRGRCNGAQLYNDYGHHAEEVKATIASMAPVPKNRLWVVYQPALFTRFKATFPRLVTCFQGADKVIIIDIYGAREPEDPTLHSLQLVGEIQKLGQDCQYIPTMEEAAAYLEKELAKGDICLIMGSGTIDKLDSYMQKD